MTKEEKVKQYPNSIDTRVALLEMSISHINETLQSMKEDAKEFRNEARSDFRWLMGMIIGLSAFTVGGFAGTLAVIAHGFHWI
jgi:hypothetical protein